MATNLIGQDMTGWLWNATDPNARYFDVDPNAGLGAYVDLNRLGVSLAPQITNYLGAAGYTGFAPTHDYFGQHTIQKALERQSGAPFDPASYYGGGFNDDGTPIGFQSGVDYSAFSRDPAAANPELADWLKSQGLGLQFGVQHTPGASQKTWIQRLVDSQGNPVAVDAFNDRAKLSDPVFDKILPAAVAATIATAGLGAAGAFGGTAGGTAGGAAGGTAGASGSAAASGGSYLAGSAAPVLTTEGLGSAASMGIGLSNSAPLALVPGFEAAVGAGAAGLGASAGSGSGSLLGDAAVQATVDSGSLMGGSLGGADIGGFGGSLGSAGGAGLGAGGGVLTSPTPSNGLGGLLGQLQNSGVGQAVGAVADAVGGGQNLAGIVGGIAGAMEGGKPNTATQQSQIDPRMAQYLYGSGYGDANSLLGAAQQLWQQNKSGLNPTMQQGLDMQRAALTDPAYGQAFTQMRQQGMGLLNAPVAGNPFTQGLLSLQAPQMGQQAAPNVRFPRPAGGLLGA